VSRTFRAEAEREFALTRLSELKLSWEYDGELRLMSRVFDFECKIRMKEFLCLLGNGQQAKFRFDVTSKLFDISDSNEVARDRPWGCSIVRDNILELLRYRDFSNASRHQPISIYTAQLGHHVNDIPPEDMTVDLDNQTLSFQWKAFLNNFFKDAAYFRKHKQDTPPIEYLVEQTLSEIYRGDDIESMAKDILGAGWVMEFGKEDDIYFEEAYLHRIRCTKPEELSRFVDDGGEKLCFWAAGMIACNRHSRNLSMLQDYLRKHPMPNEFIL
jgi:hypothetical protein